jgi:hypothetical protein
VTVDSTAALYEACRIAGLTSTGADLIRSAENTLYRLPGQVVARVTRPGQASAAAKEVQVSRWLDSLGFPVVQVAPGIEQPVVVDGRAVTFWRQLPEHRYATYAELATSLRRLHSLPPPPFDLPPVAPFVRLRERLSEATGITDDDRAWLLDHLTDLEAAYASLPAGLAWCAVHGDAWSGNLPVTATGPVMLDLERFAWGPPEWDLTSIAVSHTTFGNMSAGDWSAFCEAYGHDVTSWPGFDVLRDARELRKVTFAIQMAGQRPNLAEQAAYRVACIQGRHGPRPWGWVGVA